MDLANAPLALLNFITGTVVPFLFVLTIIVFIHEMGHFLVARWNRVKVDAFSVGFGPELFGFNDKRGTRWKLCAVPLGGYVKFFGDADGTSRPDHEKLASMNADEREGAFEDKAVWQRALVVVAGPVANFLLAIVIYTCLFMVHNDVRIAPVVGEIVAGSPAELGGFKKGDRIVELNGEKIIQFRQIVDVTLVSSGEPLAFVVKRDGKEIALTTTPKLTKHVDRFGNTHNVAMIGLRSQAGQEFVTVTALGPIAAFNKAVKETWITLVRSVRFIKQLFTGKQDASELRGPIGIGHVTSQVATLGFAQLMSLAALISISIGLMNLFPIPMLDGGHLMFYAIEAVRGRALSPKAMDVAYKMGLSCVLALMVFATSNDIFRLFGAG